MVIKHEINTKQVKEDAALKYYEENCKDDFETACLPLMIYLAKEHYPMTRVVVEADRA